MRFRGLLEQLHRGGGRGHATRAGHLDAMRGLAIACMIVDHLALYADLDAVRWTIGRLALPLFFILAGHLVRRLSWRLLAVGVAGLLLPQLAPWVDDPNVLLWYATGAVVIVGWRRTGWPWWPLIAAGLTLGANGWAELLGRGYNPLLLLAMMALGAGLNRDQLGAFRRVPRQLRLLGRWPLTIYIGHVLLLTALLGGPA